MPKFPEPYPTITDSRHIGNECRYGSLNVFVRFSRCVSGAGFPESSPISPWIFLLTPAIAVLAIIPFVGFLLMMLIIPFWVPFMINAGFIVLAFESAIGIVSRLWILAPLIWFGGHLAVTMTGRVTLAKIDADLRVSNVTRTIRYEPDRHALVIWPVGFQNIEPIPALLRQYGAPVVYAPDEYRDKVKVWVSRGTTAWRLGDKELCDRIVNDRMLPDAGASIRERDTQTGACIYGVPEEPKLPVVSLASREFESPYYGVNGRWRETEITAPRERVTIRTAFAAPLTWFPLPTIVCGLRECAYFLFNSFYSQYRHIGADNGDRDQWGLAMRALGLQEMSQPPTPRNDVGMSALDDALARHRAHLGEILEALLSDDANAPDHHAIQSLLIEKRIITNATDRLANNIRFLIRNGRHGKVLDIHLILLSISPKEDFQRVGQPIIDILTEYINKNSYSAPFLNDKILRRFGELGPTALPVLEYGYKQRNSGSLGAINGMCRVGPAAAAVLSKHIEDLISSRNITYVEPSMRKGAALAALRIGRTDLADRLDTLVRNSPKYSGSDVLRRPSDWPNEFPRWRATITPASDPIVCDVVDEPE